MVCDYYRIQYIIIKYINKDNQQCTEIIELSMKKGYFSSDFDRDFQTYDSYFNGLKQIFSNKNIYFEGKWLCLEERIDEYKYFIKRFANLSNLVHIYKSYDFVLR